MAGWAPDKKMVKKMLDWEKSGEMPAGAETLQQDFESGRKKQVGERNQKNEEMRAKQSMNETINRVRQYKERMKMKRKSRGRGILKGIGGMSAFKGGAPSLISGKRFEGGSTKKG